MATGASDEREEQRWPHLSQKGVPPPPFSSHLVLAVGPRVVHPSVGMALLLACASAVFSTPAHNFTVAAYLPEWRYEGANWVDMSRTVSQLILFSLEVQPTGRLSAYDRLPRRELMTEARAATKAAGTKLLVCVGGNGRSAGFSPAVAKKERRQRFVDDLVKLCDKHDLDGVDLNWEYPGYTFGSGYHDDEAVARDYKGLRSLLKLLYAAFEPSGRVITIAYYPDGRQERLFTEYGVGCNFEAQTWDPTDWHPRMDAGMFEAIGVWSRPTAERYVVNMHAMSYDQPGKHSTWDFANKVAKQGAELLPAHLVSRSRGDWTGCSTPSHSCLDRRLGWACLGWTCCLNGQPRCAQTPPETPRLPQLCPSRQPAPRSLAHTQGQRRRERQEGE